MNNLIQSLQDARETALAGGKAVNLGELLRAGFPVPDGFVVTTAAFRAARETGNADEILSQVAAAFKKMGGAVAVRSSATAEDMAGASMAGQYDTFLNIDNETALIEAVKACWASIDSPRTRAYLAQNGIAIEKVAMAAVVQKLVPAEVAGVMFTVNPHTGSRDEMLIEAAWGLGEAVVSGLVQPDVLRIRANDGGVIEQIVADKQIMITHGARSDSEHGEKVPEEKRRAACLNSQDVAQLHALAIKAAKHFGKPQDIEWAVADGKVYQLQSRPITTLENVEAYYEVLASQRERLKKLAAEKRGPWALHNLAETLPHPTPLTWSAMKLFMSGHGVFGHMYRAAGFTPTQAACDEGFLELIAGRVYMDASRAPEMFFARYPFRYDVEALKASPEASQNPPTIPTGSLAGRMLAGRRIRKSNRILHAAADDTDVILENFTIPELLKWRSGAAGRDPGAMAGEEFAKHFVELWIATMANFPPQFLLPSLIAGVLMEDLKTFLAERFWDRDAEELAQALSSPLAADKTVSANAGLYRVAHGTMPAEAWLAEFGHRAPNEFDLSTPRWRERPAELLAMATRLKDGPDPAAQHQAHVEKVKALQKELAAKMSLRDAVAFAGLLDRCRRNMRFREDGKFYLMMAYDQMRIATLEAGRRLAGTLLDKSDDVFFLTFEEVAKALAGKNAGDLRKTAAQRRRVYEAEARITLPRVIDAGDIDSLGNPAAHIDKNAAKYEAFALSTGSAKGPVRIVRDPAQAANLGTGYILVCTSTDPAWTPLFVSAGGLVLECGGTLSHGAVVAREMGIPAVVLADATTLLSEGETITVDGHGGAVYRAGAEKAAIEYASPQAVARQVDEHSTKIDPNLRPPPPGRRERFGRKLRTWSLVFWAIFLLLAFLLPSAEIYDEALRAIDLPLWPLIRALGKPGGVAAIAALMAAATMIAQYFLTDVKRLREAQRRAKLLNKEAERYAKDSPRRAALRAAAAPVQSRIMGATMLPLAILLGPLVMIFMWLPARLEFENASPNPGSDVMVVAEIESNHRGPIVMQPIRGFRIEDDSQELKPIRETLEALLKDPAALVEAARGRDKAPADLAADLKKYLAHLPPQQLSWHLRAEDPSTQGRFRGAIMFARDGGVPIEFTLGEQFAPSATDVTHFGKISRVEIKPMRPPAARPIFFALTLPGWQTWDFGIWGVYLIVYVPVMLALKFGLRLP